MNVWGTRPCLVRRRRRRRAPPILRGTRLQLREAG
eukprot:SAG25_NODE_9230_length_381_cov_1.634752_1_plen_34_part_10